MKKTIATFLALALLITATGAGLYAGGGQSGGSSGVTPVTMLLLGNNPTNGRIQAALAEINKLLGPRVGAELRVQYIEWADWQNQYQLTLASGDRNIDLVITATDWLFAWEISRKGGFLGMTPELLRKNAPKTWAAVPASHWDLCTDNGKIWFIPEDQYTQYTNHGMYWRKDWAREGGVTDVAVFEDLEKYFDAVKKNHPEAYPWDVGGDGGDIFSGYFISKTNYQTIIGAATGNYGIFWYDTRDPYTVVSPYMDGPQMADAAVMYDRWAKKGFWREDVLNYRGETGNLLLAGLSGADQHHTQTYLGSRVNMDREQPGSELQFYYWGKENKNVNKDLLTHGAMAVNAASRNVDKALQVYDLLRNDKQIYQLYNFGIEGKDYVINSNGTWARPATFNTSTDNIDSNFWGGRMDAYEPTWADAWVGRPGLFAELNSFAKEYALEKFAFDNTKVAAEMAAIGDVCSTYIATIQFGKTPDPRKAVEDFRAALRRAGYDKVKAELQAQLTAFKNKR